MVGRLLDSVGSGHGGPSGQSPSAVVLVVGGSGYLGQQLVQQLLTQGWKVGYTYASNVAKALQHADLRAFQVDLATGRGLYECFDAMGPIARVVNCASLCPTASEADPRLAAAVNVPSKLLDALDRHMQVHGTEPFLVHISTDQVHDGKRKLSAEWHAGSPVNVYGRTKLAGEKEVACRWPRHAILRAGPLFGPPPPAPLASSTPWLQQLDADLADKKPVLAATDEVCTPTYTEDLLRAIRKVCARQDALPNRIIHVGCPDRQSRYDLAVSLAEVRGYEPSLIVGKKQAELGRGCKAPADVSMNSIRLERDLLMLATPFKVALLEIFRDSK